MLGLLDAVLISTVEKGSTADGTIQLMMVFSLGVALLGWCFVDSEERRVPIAGWIRLAMLGLPIVGVPWYFIRSRGALAAAKSGFGLGLFGVWFSGVLVAAFAIAVAQEIFPR